MPKRDPDQRLDDIREACRKILRYTKGRTHLDPLDEDPVFDAVVRNIEVIGEAAKHIPNEVRDLYPAIKWTHISAMRDRLAHGYFDVDPEIVGEVVAKEIPALLEALR